MKILNLYACLGGNRYKWDDVAKEAGIEIEVTAVELDPEAARLYQERIPNDIVIVADAHQYLLDHYKEFDFIWSSPPCPTHSKARYWGFGKNGLKLEYPDMKLYEEIIFLKYYFFGKWVVENVNPYYEPMFNPVIRERHTYWANFHIPHNISNRNDTALVQASRLKDLCDFHDYDFKKYKGEQRILKMARNLVDYEAGKTILETALNIVKKSNTNQISIFDEMQELQGEV
jgi:DNA (cytosine-5)-methyltransferase 1